MGKLLKSYVFWAHERGSIHYDVMVTLILLFMFVTPHFVDFRDKPKLALRSSEVLVKEAGMVGDTPRFRYEIRAEDLAGAGSDAEIRAAILRVVEPISGEVRLQRYEAVKDASGHVMAYDAWVVR